MELDFFQDSHLGLPFWYSGELFISHQSNTCYMPGQLLGLWATYNILFNYYDIPIAKYLSYLNFIIIAAVYLNS
jgi:hypothetical protein